MPSYFLTDAVNAVWRNLRDYGQTADQQLLTDTEITAYVDAAVARYSIVRPQVKVEDVIADGSSTVALPAGFDPDFGAIISIETPIGQVPAQYVDPRYYRLYQTPTGYVIQWLYGGANAGQGIRVTYHAMRAYGTVDASTTSVLDMDHDAVVALATSYACLAIAGKYARTTEPVFNAEGVNMPSKVDNWTAISRRWSDIWLKHANSVAGTAAATVNWDTRLSVGYDHLTHPRWRR